MSGSISLRFTIVSIIAIVIVLGSSGIYNYYIEHNRLYAQQESKATLIMKQVELNTPLLLWDYQVAQLQNLLVSLAQSKDVLGIFIIDAEKTVIGAKRNSSDEIVLVDDYSSLGDVYKRQTIFYNDEGKKQEVGEAILLVDRTMVHKALKRQVSSLVLETVLLSLILVSLIVFSLRQLVNSPIHKVNDALININRGDGDLTQRLPANHLGEIGLLTKSVNEFIESLRSIIMGVVSNSQQMNAPIQQVNLVSKQTQTGAELQHKKINHMTEAMQHMADAAREVAQGTTEAANHAKEVTENAKEANGELKEMTQTIQTLAEDIAQGAEVINALEGDVTNIVSVLDVIRGIAEQTNLLALNAAIEAARAGEQGRGFAVVADEVRSLASKTQDSTQEIQEMIEKLQGASSKAVSIMGVGRESGEQTVVKIKETQEIVGRISHAIIGVSDMTGQIASAAEQQTAMCNEVRGYLNDVVEVVGKVAGDAKETYHASETLTELINEQSELLSKFKT